MHETQGADDVTKKWDAHNTHSRFEPTRLGGRSK